MRKQIESSTKQEPKGSPRNERRDSQVLGRAIKLPIQWDRQQDHDEFLDRFGYADSPLDFLREQLRGDYEQFNTVLDHALNHYLGQVAFALVCDVTVLSAEEKIEWLLELVATRSARASYRVRFEENLAECLFMDRERRRVLRSLLRATEKTWLYPLCDLADGLIGCAMSFEESLICEDCGYRQPLVFHNEAVRFAVATVLPCASSGWGAAASRQTR
jgi:hypothetical protein